MEDIQKVFGRDGLNLPGAHPGQPPLDPRAPFGS